MIETTLGNIERGYNGFTSLARKPLSPAVSFRIARVQAALDDVIRTFVAERDKLIEKLGEKNEDGVKEIKRKNPKYSEYQKAVEKMLEVPVTLAVNPIPMTVLIEEGQDLVPADLAGCLFLFDLGDEGATVEAGDAPPPPETKAS